MLKKISDFVLNKRDSTSIVCRRVTGDHVRLKSDEFSDEIEFSRWKQWSDNDYHRIELDGRYDDDCISLDSQQEVQTQSAEDIILAPYIEVEQMEARRILIEKVKSILTKKQFRRMCMYYLDGMSEAKIAALEGVNQSSISRSISKGTKAVEKFFEKFSRNGA